jgi:hypothetical protein
MLGRIIAESQGRCDALPGYLLLLTWLHRNRMQQQLS